VLSRWRCGPRRHNIAPLGYGTIGRRYHPKMTSPDDAAESAELAGTIYVPAANVVNNNVDYFDKPR